MSAVGMAKLQFARLTEAWKGEATDFTPLLVEQLDALGDAIGIDLASVGESEVVTTGGRSIDIVAQSTEGFELIVENQYGRADHDHLTRGLAYAVARRARGLVLVAEEHRDEFRAVAQYLNDLAELDSERGIAVWLVEAKAVRIDDGRWAPLFSAVVEPNSFTTAVRQEDVTLPTLDEFWKQFSSVTTREVVQELSEHWKKLGNRFRLGPNHMVLEAAGPSINGYRTVVALYSDGRVLVPFSSYEGQNSGIPIDELATESFRNAADGLFGFKGSERQARTAPGWISPEHAVALRDFCVQVANAYGRTLGGGA